MTVVPPVRGYGIMLDNELRTKLICAYNYPRTQKVCTLDGSYGNSEASVGIWVAPGVKLPGRAILFNGGPNRGGFGGGCDKD